ncbi:response regulator transcription factor [Clostridium saccharoperbutylacetonicum]|uniref:response regulator transcription factor n=1 Tax=Clostridium saccharoperbutylacetonicum TaxID=36745 RepID=UPI000983DABC|nr:response regulator [Clostridium saccharoperbutylacetonicum]AQR93681.1 putative response regulatory protein [Clostridium saccharoperbutylacetonicum]NSB29380.1 two-component system response regulator YesN [Clostridium saccharoperbutylacetonicum]
MKILIVEDEINAREGLGNLLGKINNNYIVCGKASDGEQGLTLAKEHKPDLIFTDIEMPKLNGLDMLEKIKEDGQNPYIIILSGYSDFKYAQKSIRIGVEEYLLKPITYSALKSSMEQIERKFNLEKEKSVTFDDEMIKEEILGQILLNKSNNLKELYKIIESKLDKEKNIYLVNLYLGDKYEDEIELRSKEMNDFMEKYKIEVVYYSVLKEYGYLPILINTQIAFEELVKILKYNLLFSFKARGFYRTTISVINMNDISEIGKSFSKLQKLSRWPIVLGNDEIIYEALISKLKICQCNYPREIESEVLKAIKSNDKIKLVDANKKFISYLKSDIYDPINVIEVCSKYIFSILSVSKSCNNDLYTEFNNEGILDTIKMSCTFCELEERLNYIIGKACKKNNEELIPYSLIVRKTINYIKEYYSDKISLEEIASGMSITPEYLSRLFTKELGKSFSDYLREFRIDKSKELLTTSKIKIYEVAEKVGYSDSKYFCKVFKESTGMSPKEYMKFY